MYLIKLEPIFKPKLWGREIWLISDLPGAESVVANGEYKGMTLNQLIQDNRELIIGEGNLNKQCEGFPLLIKIIEADQNLSVQVHPDNFLAKAKGLESGKDEMWYVMEAQLDAELVAGLSTIISPEEYEERVKNGSFSVVLNYYKATKGDVFNIPAGRVHALGGGIKVAEIQQASDTTFRIYDYNRKDKEGKLRELHVEEAKEAINYYDVKGDSLINYPHSQNIAQPLVQSSSFNTSFYELSVPKEFEYSKKDSFVIWMCVEGECLLLDENGFSESMTCGEAVLIPAALKRIHIDPEPIAKILEIYIS